MIGSSSLPSVDHVLPYTECECAAPITSGPGRVHLRVDGECRLVHRQVALHDLAVVAHQQEVADADVPEVHAEGVHPEVVGELGITGGDVSGDALVEPEPAEQPEGCGEALLAVQPLLLDRAVGAGKQRGDVPACELLGVFDSGVHHGDPFGQCRSFGQPAAPSMVRRRACCHGARFVGLVTGNAVSAGWGQRSASRRTNSARDEMPSFVKILCRW